MKLVKTVFKKIDTFGWEKVGGTLLVLCFFATIGGAAFFQYVLDQPPCFLCYVQRVPYWIGGLLGALSLMKRISLKTRRKFLILAALVLFVNMFISAYAVGVEQHWWEGPAVCSVSETLTTEEINAVLQGTAKPIVPCNKVRWTLFDLPYLTLAFFNVFICLFMTIILSLLVRYKKAWQKKK